MTVKIKKVKDNAKIPKRATNGSAGMDLYACIDEKITINPGQLVLVPTGIAIELSDNSVAAFLYARSGLGIKHGICLSNGVGVVDSDYRGEICAGLCNVSDKPYEIEPLKESVRWSSLLLFRVMLKRLRSLATQSVARAVLAQQVKNNRISTIYHCPYL